MNLNDVTLISMTSVDIDRTIRALEYSAREIKFKSIKLITDKRVSHTNIEVCYIKEMKSIDDYSFNIVYNLKNYVDTDYVLIIQSDGFVINPKSWRNDFFDYDYIGAPWPLPSDNFSFRDIFGNIVRVGNGGFSFRSKKLIELPSKLNLEWKPYFGFYNEDGFFTCHNRHILEEQGCLFAPLDVAKYFSIESELPENLEINPFGFHSKWLKYNYLI
jgi:hypothetical protein